MEEQAEVAPGAFAEQDGDGHVLHLEHGEVHLDAVIRRRESGEFAAPERLRSFSKLVFFLLRLESGTCISINVGNDVVWSQYMRDLQVSVCVLAKTDMAAKPTLNSV